jgi:hypothetical protein
MDAFAPSLVVSLLSGLAILVGMLLFVLPGLVILVAWGYALWFVALQQKRAVDALGASWRLLKQRTGSVVIVFIIILVLNSAGAAIPLASLLSFPLGVLVATIAFDELAR